MASKRKDCVFAKMLANYLVTAVTCCLAVASLSHDAQSLNTIGLRLIDSQPDTHKQYAVSEFVFEASVAFDYPPSQALLLANFSQAPTAGGGWLHNVVGFWDGNRTWRLRFAPTKPGQWQFVAVLSDRVGQMTPIVWHSEPFEAALADRDGHAIFAHGGQLKVSENRRYLTFWDGTPFFWLGDTWWFTPSEKVPYDTSSNLTVTHSAFRYMVDKRSSQNYSIIQVRISKDHDFE